ncbi:MAG: hypothetical protein UV42_C0059G0006, partial [Candidatus Magasanikbacteria bacterium GW2011_GWE2_42_7]
GGRGGFRGHRAHLPAGDLPLALNDLKGLDVGETWIVQDGIGEIRRLGDGRAVRHQETACLQCGSGVRQRFPGLRHVQCYRIDIFLIDPPIDVLVLDGDVVQLQKVHFPHQQSRPLIIYVPGVNLKFPFL